MEDVNTAESVTLADERRVKKSRKACIECFKARPITDWIVLAISCVCIALLMGYVYGLSALFIEIMSSFQSSRAMTVLIQSLTIGIMCTGGFVAPLAASMVGFGMISIISSIVASSAIISAFFIEDLVTIIVVSGIIGGLGLCNLFAIPFIAIGKVFKDCYNSALAALMLAGGLGYFSFPYLNVLMFKAYGWRAVFLLHGGLLLNFLPLGMFFRIKLAKEKDSVPSKNSEKRCSSDGNYFKSHVSLWKDPLHVTFFICLILRSVPLGLVNYFMLDIAAYKGFNEVDGSLFLSAVGLGNITGRAVILATRPIMKIDPVKEYSCDVIFTGITIALIALVNNFGFLLAICFLFGFPYGMLSSTAHIAVFTIAGQDRFPTALGIYNTGLGIGFGIAGPIGGVIKDNVESYDLILYAFAITSILCGLCCFIVSYYQKKKSTVNTQSIDVDF